jgi:hypothetical protein
MPIPTQIRVLGALGVLASLVACSAGGSTAISPMPVSGRGAPMIRHLVSYDSCSASASIEYVSDAFYNVINVYAGKIVGQAPCGQIASTLLNNPQGLFVKPGTHDLYVANTNAHNVLVFRRGSTSPYNTYTDPSVQDPLDVAVAEDGTVIASNYVQAHGAEAGSLSTWIRGPNGGTFVGNFPMTNDLQGEFVAVASNGTVYYDDVDQNFDQGALWSLSCPAGACGAQTQVAGVSFKFPGGMAFSAKGDLLVNDQNAATADTFELPNPTPSTFPLAGFPFGMAIDKKNHHWFISDAISNKSSEYTYPGGVLVGSVTGASGGITSGIAADP